MGYAAAALLALSACGRVGFGARGDGGTTDAVTDASSPLCIDLVLHVPFDGNSLERVSQTSGIVQGGVVISPTGGIVGGAASFPGNGYVDFALGATAPTTEFTIAIWIQPQDLVNRTVFYRADSLGTACS